MQNKHFDIIIIGSGISGLYSAYNIKKSNPNTSFAVLEKYKKAWIGGRASNEMFYGSRIVTGAGIGRKDTNPLLIKLCKELGLHYEEYKSIMDYSKTIPQHVDIVKIIDILRKNYKQDPTTANNMTFKQFGQKVLGKKMYSTFTISVGYTDYENADVKETLYNYGMDDNKSGWIGLHIPWKKLIETLASKIGYSNIKFSSNVTSISKVQNKPCMFKINLENNTIYTCNRVIIATTIDSVQKLLPQMYQLYSQIQGQTFLRLYAKFDKKSSKIMAEYVKHYTIVPGPLQKIIPINHDKGVYMIAYSDNDNAKLLRPYIANTSTNRELFEELIEKSLGMPTDTQLTIIALKNFYWPIGTHYFRPLREKFVNFDAFLKEAQHPVNGMIVVGEAFSRYQGWSEGALESVEKVVTTNWVDNMCN